MHSIPTPRKRLAAAVAAVLALATSGTAQEATAGERDRKRSPAAPTRLAPPVQGRQLIFAEEFDEPIQWGERWNGTGTSAYKYWDHNDWYMTDWVTRDAVSVHDGMATFTASPSDHSLEDGTQAWDTGLLSTEHTNENFKVQVDDYIETRVQLPTQMGAWPALWTWSVDAPGFRGGSAIGNNEIDTFEYHPDSVDDLEFTNHVRHSVYYYSNHLVINPGRWITVGTHYRSESVDWYVNGQKVHSDGKGVPDTWKAHPILNLSLADGTYHPVPTDAQITFNADYVRVFRALPQ
ncbi:beta-glucanase [Streptomyces polyrhachis]|uniref:Beta-glucanase n=1 Tax=Streptomyces polyrhachis TaxID=1282885 RepID=A0ABW2GC16_9ACTN